MKTYDIVICGAGISGAVAAISAGRAGCSVLLIDRLGCPGGMLTSGGVGPMMTFHAGETQVVQGITGELIDRMAAKGLSTGHVTDTTHYTYTVTPFDAEGMKLELEDMLTEAGVTLLYHAMLSDVHSAQEEITHLTFAVKGGHIDAAAKIFIDATGDADLAYMANVPCDKGMDDEGTCQPLTTNVKLINVDIPAVKAFMREKPENFPRMSKSDEVLFGTPRLSINGYLEELREAQALGEISFPRECVLIFETNNPGEVIVNMSRMQDFDPLDPWQLSQAETLGRQHARELIRFLNKRVCGFENALMVQTSPGQVGVRSSRQIQGLYTLTYTDLILGKRFEDTIAHGGYPIDVHEPKGGFSEEFLALTPEQIAISDGHIYSIPYRSLLNSTRTNLITVGRCISADFIAQSSIRVSPIAGAIGHGGGAAAALAIKQNKAPADLTAQDLRALLLEQGAYL